MGRKSKKYVKNTCNCNTCQFETSCNTKWQGTCKSYLPKIIKQSTTTMNNNKINKKKEIKNMNSSVKISIAIIFIIMCIISILDIGG